MTLSLPFSPAAPTGDARRGWGLCKIYSAVYLPSGTERVQSSNMAEVVRYAPGELIEKNAFHLELKLTLAQQDQEIASLNEAIIAQKKDFDDLKARYETLDGMHRMTMEQFASEYHALKAASGNGPKPLTLAGVLPLPKIRTREACPEIVQWNREVYLRSIAKAKAQKRGETDGNAITVRKKAKAGRPPKTTDNDEDSDSHGHLYLKNLDGTLISTASLRKLSSKARSVWFTLADHDEAPLTWGKVSDIAGEYYYRHVLNEPGLEFLQYCDDGIWKLREWTQLLYSGWARNHGVREPQLRQKDAQEGLEEGGLDDPKLAAREATDASDALRAMLSALDDTSPSTSTHRLTIKLGPRPRPLTTATASVTQAEGNISDTPPSSGSSSAAGPSGPSNRGPETTPTEMDVVNIRLERAQLGANNEKKRKPDNNTPRASALTKKQKTSAALAIPLDGNSIKNICMRRWNELQPGGQGLTSNFEEYFKTLTDIDKEPFRKEMRAIQFANNTSGRQYFDSDSAGPPRDSGSGGSRHISHSTIGVEVLGYV
ncbi:hypothetical protein EDB86DRAFT_2829125 [Lactarius hatsudake]|nr:hypothetical protein EDB86DRAFT_2829125 [Lactarius hatsudake]